MPEQLFAQPPDAAASRGEPECDWQALLRTQ
jgi:hypothetical protein